MTVDLGRINEISAYNAIFVKWVDRHKRKNKDFHVIEANLLVML
jgi:hypothetical protein